MVRDGLVSSFLVFSQYYLELFPPRNVTVMRKQPGTPNVHVSQLEAVLHKVNRYRFGLLSFRIVVSV